MGNPELKKLIDSVTELHCRIRDAARRSIANQMHDLADVVASGHGDVSYGIDMICETMIDDWFSSKPPEGGVVVISEGLGRRVYPKEIQQSDAAWRLLIDPLDGTRHIMYDNRSAWVLTGIAPNRGEQTDLSDICAAVQTEVPVSLQTIGVVMTAQKNSSADIKVYDLKHGIQIETHLKLARSGADTLENGFCVFTNVFLGMKRIISELEERVLYRLVGSPADNSATVFSEQYISTAGQLYMLMTGKYRVVVDIRAALGQYLHKTRQPLPLCVHPYDLSSSLIAEEGGCIICDVDGKHLNYKMDLDTNCAWFGYANESLYRVIHPIIIDEMKKMELL